MKALAISMISIGIVAVLVVVGVFVRDVPRQKALSTATASFSIAPHPSPTVSSISGACVVSGCSSQVCSDDVVITTCEWRQDFICYRNAKCERQSDGRCGWTQTPELTSCLFQFETL